MPDSHSGRGVGRVFVGRKRETAELRKALSDALTGQGRLVLLSGEPGVGKTRLIQELASFAEQEGARVLWGWCPEEEGAPPYRPWQQILRGYLHKGDADQLVSEIGAGAAEIAELVPDVRSIMPELQPAQWVEADQARFRLFDSITAFLKNAANSQPMVLVIDDLHWADRSSLMLLEFLAREIRYSRLLFVGAYNGIGVVGEHPLAQTLGGLVREPHFQRVQLSGLTKAEVGEFVETTVGTVEQVWRRTEGNALFIGEMMRLVTSDELDRSGAWADSIPEGVRNVIGRRLGRLSSPCNQILRIAALIGKEFDYQLLGAISSDLGKEAFIDALEEASSQGVIAELPQRAGGYQFTHTLVQQTLAQDVSTARRASLHEQIAGELETRYGHNAEAYASELAHHYALSASAAATDKLVHYSRLAGERALATFAFEDALSHFQLALTARGGPVAEGWEENLNDESAAILFGVAQAQAAILQRSQLQEARTNLNRVLDYYIESGDVGRAVTVAIYPIPPFGGSGDTIRLLDRILSLVPPESIEAGVLHARYGFVLGVEEGDHRRAQHAFERAMLIASQEKNSDLEMRTLTDAARVDSYNHWWGSSLEKSLRAVELAQRGGNTRLELAARYRAAWAFLTLGNPTQAMEQSKLALEIAEAVRDRYWLVNSLWLNELLCRLCGHWEAGIKFSNRALSLWPRDPRLLGSRTLLEYETGNFGTGAEYLERLIEAMVLTPPGASLEYANVACIVPIVARITGHTDQLERAAVAGMALLSSPEATEGLVKDVTAGLAFIAVIQSETAEAEKHYLGLMAEEGQILFASLSGDRLLGLQAHTLSRYDDAVTHFTNGLAFCQKAGYKPEFAWTCHDYAEVLLQRGAIGDRAKSITLLEESLAISSALGMRPLMDRVIVLQEKAQSRSVPAPAYPDGLTQREVEVLRLVAAGKTDREIGEELFISVKTVGNHVSNILNKTNTANRTEAATYAAMHSLSVFPGPDTQ